ncbi:hypothetical protein D9M71_690230 [compost metagenome]
MVAKATAERKPRNRLPPTALARCMATMLPPPISAPLMSPPTKYCGSLPTMTMAEKPRVATTRKKKPMKPVAKNTDLRASLALGTVKKRIRMCGRPAMPNTRPSDIEAALNGSASMLPGPRIALPMAWVSTARSARVE